MSVGGGDTRTESVLAATAGRDRVLDFVKALALLVVVVGHSLAWDVTGDMPGNVVESHPGLTPVTWIVQVLPLFFAAGAVSHLASWRRHRVDADAFWRRRLVRLMTPLVLYTVVWTLVLLPLSPAGGAIEGVGRFLSQLTWFLGMYGVVVLAVPMTARWTARPWVALLGWFVVLIAVDLIRWLWWPPVGWVNFVLVWGWLHQLGYHLPDLRRSRPRVLGLGAAGALGAALALAVGGPYSSSMVSVGGDDRMSNLAPPTVALALFGLAQVLALAALWPALGRLLARPRVWVATAVFGSRAMGVYLWHIPVVGLVVLPIWRSGMTLPSLSWQWWALHLAGIAVVLPVAWLIAGLAGRGDRVLQRRGAGLPATGRAGTVAALAIPVVALNAAVTGYATIAGQGMPGLPSSSVVNMVVLVVCWALLAGRGGDSPGTGSDVGSRSAGAGAPG